MAGAVLAALVLIIAIAPLFIPEERANQAEPELILRSPSAQFPFGTDDVGRDILARSLYGGRISLTIGATAAFLGIGLGLVIGALAGYYGGVRDAALMRLADAMLSMPSLLLLIVLGRIFGSSVPVLIAVIGGLSWMTVARIVRGNVLSLREQDFVVAARAMGADSRMVLVRHVVPNTLAPVIVAATLGVGNAILLEAGASFLGLGSPAPHGQLGEHAVSGPECPRLRTLGGDLPRSAHPDHRAVHQLPGRWAARRPRPSHTNRVGACAP